MPLLCAHTPFLESLSVELPEKFANNFTESCQALGAELVAQQRVKALWGGYDRFCCECQDGDTVVTSTLQIEGKALIPACDCVTFQQGTMCPHLWAAILCAHQQYDLNQALRRSVSKFLPVVKAGNSPATAKNNDPHYDFEQRPRPKTPTTPNSNQPRVVYDVPAQPATTTPMPNFVLSDQARCDILYVIRLESQPRDGQSLLIETWWRPQTPAGTTPPAAQPFIPEGETAVPTANDRELLRLLWAARASAPVPTAATKPAPHAFTVPAGLLDSLLPMLAESGHARWLSQAEKPPRLHPIRSSTSLQALPAVFAITFTQLASGIYTLTGWVHAPEKSTAIHDCKLVLPAGYILSQGEFIPVNFARAEQLAIECHMNGPIALNPASASARARHIAINSDLDLSALPSALQIQRLQGQAVPELFVRTARFTFHGHEQLHAELSFSYDGARCNEQDNATRLPGARPGSIIVRDLDAEERCRERLKQLGFRWNRNTAKEEPGWKLSPTALDTCVRTLVMDNWIVHAEGKTYRKPAPKTATISSGLDWFDLQADTSFDGLVVPLPALLKAKQHGANAVRLDDGTYGLLPMEWLENFTALTEIGEAVGEKLRFRREQTAIVDALLKDRQTEADDRFQHQLAAITAPPTPAASAPPPSFQATLRPYQLDGLQWLLHMQQLGLGACLADDMGLGKTVQVLALLESRRCLPAQRPSLIVMPKSLIFNWQAEAARFAPALRLAIHTGSARQCRPDAFHDADLVLTTYGTLRNDAIKLAKVHFDYCILDESQAIKNRDSATARAARVIKADHRLVMTGTPMENHLGELFSQLDFLNPGLVGAKLANTSGTTSAALSSEQLRRLSQGVRPFILRRTKQQVAKDLPPKNEQIIWCEMNDEQRRDYEDLRLFYRQALMKDDTQKEPAANTKSIDALAALLRLRQAACHPALIDEKRLYDGSAKLDLVEERLLTIIDAGHKALVFSQFTRFLHLVQNRLAGNGIDVCYLDGQTKDRAALVNSFQEDPAKRVFLISLKAGGVGLNLTAADYVFILDPWWNPAVEAQAIDRAYRIGQSLPVFAYRLVTRDTVEEKVITLQNQKRRLANAVLGNPEQSTTIKKLSQDDLRFLLS